MPIELICARYLRFQDFQRNSDKIFNVFLVKEQNSGEYSCVTEYGRRGLPVVRRTIYRGTCFNKAGDMFERKVIAKLSHRSTPYEENPDGQSQSEFYAEFCRSQISEQTAPTVADQTSVPSLPKSSSPMLNVKQFDSLEF